MSTPHIDDRLVALRSPAALLPCPAGLGPELLSVTLPCLSGGPAVRLGGTCPSVVDEEGDVLRAFGSGPPITVLLDAAGEVKHVKRGEFDDVGQIAALVEQSLGIRL